MARFDLTKWGVHFCKEIQRVDDHHFVLDETRKDRIVKDEAILCEQKTGSQIAQIVGLSRGQGRLFTRLSPGKFNSQDSDN